MDERWGVPGTGERRVWRQGDLVVKGNGSGKANRQVPFLLGQSDLLHHKLMAIIALSRAED